jgi:uncharacterized protein (TIGR02246 family)
MRIAILLLSAALAAAQVAHPTEEAAVRDVVQRYSDARDGKDPRAIGTLFSDNADQLVSSGEWRRGKEALVQGMLASSARDAGKRILTVETVRFLGRDVAIADARYEIGDRKMWSTFILRRSSRAWRIEGIRNMLPTPSGTAATQK